MKRLFKFNKIFKLTICYKICYKTPKKSFAIIFSDFSSYLDHQKEIHSIAHCMGRKKSHGSLDLNYFFSISKNFQYFYPFVKKLYQFQIHMGCERFPHISRFRLDYLKTNFYTWKFFFLRKGIFLPYFASFSLAALHVCCLDLQPTWFKTLRQALQRISDLKCLPKPLNI